MLCFLGRKRFADVVIDMMAPMAGKRSPSSKYGLFAGMRFPSLLHATFLTCWWSDLPPRSFCVRRALYARCAAPWVCGRYKEDEGGMGAD